MVQTHTGGLGLQLVKTHAILQHADERVRLDIGRKGQRFGVADPAAGQLQRGIAEAGLLEVSPDCTGESVVCVSRRMARRLCGERAGTEIVHDIAAKQRHDILSAGGRRAVCGWGVIGNFWARLLGAAVRWAMNVWRSARGCCFASGLVDASMRGSTRLSDEQLPCAANHVPLSLGCLHSAAAPQRMQQPDSSARQPPALTTGAPSALPWAHPATANPSSRAASFCRPSPTLPVPLARPMLTWPA